MIERDGVPDFGQLPEIHREHFELVVRDLKS